MGEKRTIIINNHKEVFSTLFLFLMKHKGKRVIVSEDGMLLNELSDYLKSVYRNRKDDFIEKYIYNST